MILYFSATGNCKYTATRLAQGIKQRFISIMDCINNNEYAFEDKMIGIISPVYFWGLPSIVREFLEKASFQTEYLYFVATYGTIPGASGCIANRMIQGRNIDAYYSIRMVDTWTPVFDLSTPKKLAVFTKSTEKDIDNIICRIKKHYTNKHMFPRTPAILTELIAQPLYDREVRRTSHLRVQDNCIGCGLCAKKCPVQAIEMQNKKPVWIKEKCVMCLGCLHRCPEFAIQYGKNTQKHGQYMNPNVKI